MSSLRLKDRISSARAITAGRLEKHRLCFHKLSTDKSGKCDAEFTNNEKDIVYGIIFEIATSDKSELDKKEGLGKGYEEKHVSVYSVDGEELNAVTYYATKIDPNLKPYEWYKEHVIRGAREHGLPEEYIKAIERVEAISDSDKARHEKELFIYC